MVIALAFVVTLLAPGPCCERGLTPCVEHTCHASAVGIRSADSCKCPAYTSLPQTTETKTVAPAAPCGVSVKLVAKAALGAPVRLDPGPRPADRPPLLVPLRI